MSRYMMCAICGRRMRRARDIFGNWDGETYECDFCSGWYDDDDDEEDGETLSVYDAAEIWESNGRDEDYTFGYTEEELEDALSD